MSTIKPGKYKHFKGNEYEVLMTGKHTETEEELVVYRDLSDPTKVWIRPLEMFSGTKKQDDGTEIQRFERID
jgi:hypothetical protein